MADDRFSRLQATAEGLRPAAEGDVHRFVEKRVLLTGTEAALATANGVEMITCAVLLLMRTTKVLDVALPRGMDDLARDVRRWAMSHAWDEIPNVFVGPPDPRLYDAILSVGGGPRPDLPWTVITSDGWLARVTSGAIPIDQSCRQDNPIGAQAAASLGVGEVFKRLLGLRAGRGQFLNGCSFSLWTYSASSDRGPPLPDTLDVDLLLAGCGAIGNGVAHVLSRLPIRGRCTVLDAQQYGEENWGTCMRLTRKASTALKATFIATEVLSDRFVPDPVCGFVEEAEARAGWRTPRVVLSGFDNVEARHAVQDLWPDIIIDGAIGPKLECQVSAHPWGTDIACLRCIFEAPRGESARTVQTRLSGLADQSLVEPTRPLTMSDVAAAAPEKRAWLRLQIGKPICSVLESASELAAGHVKAGFRPSVPFVATMSAAMMVTELVRYLTTNKAGVQPRFLFSLLWGPGQGEHFEEDRHHDCVCTVRSTNIDRARARRTAA